MQDYIHFPLACAARTAMRQREGAGQGAEAGQDGLVLPPVDHNLIFCLYMNPTHLHLYSVIVEKQPVVFFSG